jgi:hypothetical protein
MANARTTPSRLSDEVIVSMAKLLRSIAVEPQTSAEYICSEIVVQISSWPSEERDAHCDLVITAFHPDGSPVALGELDIRLVGTLPDGQSMVPMQGRVTKRGAISFEAIAVGRNYTLTVSPPLASPLTRCLTITLDDLIGRVQQATDPLATWVAGLAP